MDDRNIPQSVEERVDEKLGFYIHLTIYLLVNAFLIAINLMTSPGTYWFLWPLIGWGMGVLFHALRVFAFGHGTAIRKRMIDAEMKRTESKPR